MFRKIILALCILCFFNTIQAQKPNVIFILVDDMGYGDLGSYGQKVLKTPHLDQMAREGMRFTRAYSGSTVCAPSRCVLMTGKHTGACTIRGNGPGELKEGETTLGTLFKQAGYITGNFGKWGIGRPKDLNNPKQHGFDEFYGYVSMMHAHNFYPEFMVHNGKKVPLRNELMDEFKANQGRLEGAGIAKEKIDYAPQFIREHMLGFIEKNHQQPFFVLYTPNTPHANNEGGRGSHRRGMEVPDYAHFDQKDWPLEEKGFAKMIYDLDQDVKNIKALLKSKGILDNTMIVFSSDNGPHQEGRHELEFFDSNGEKRGLKRDLYEGGVRVPMIVQWPSKVPVGKVNHSIVSFQDFLPTFAEILEQPTPEVTTGESILPKLTGKEMANISRSLYWEFGEKGGKQAVLKGNKKLIRLLNRKGKKYNEVYELYDVVKDPTESKNIISQYPELAETLKKEMFSIPDENSIIPKDL
jgi:arylsulfatase A-like enzyme